jgi:hypothetical protein
VLRSFQPLLNKGMPSNGTGILIIFDWRASDLSRYT